MKNYWIGLFLIISISNGSSGQSITQIVSFSHKIVGPQQALYVIEACFKYEDDKIICEVDSVFRNDPRLKEMFPFTYKVKDDWIVGKRCFKRGDLQKCVQDSVLLYTPIKYFLNKAIPCLEDTLSIVSYSSLLSESKEYRIFEASLNYEVMRFVIVQEDSALIYRVEKRGSEVLLRHKIVKYLDGKVNFAIDKSIVLNAESYNRITKLLRRGNFYNMGDDFTISPRDILIETYIDSKYYFINKNSHELKMKNKKVLKCLRVLDHLAK